MTSRYTIKEFVERKFAEKGKKLIIPAKYVNERFYEYGIIITNEDEFVNCVKAMKHKSKEEILPKLMAIIINIMKYTDKELNQHHKASNKKFMDWGNDIILFYIHRAAMDDKWAEKNPIHMIEDEEEEECVDVDDYDAPNVLPYKKCSGCGERSSCGSYNDERQWKCEDCS